MMVLAQPQSVSARDQAIMAVEQRIKLLSALADALGPEATFQDKVLEARGCIDDLRQELQKLHGRRKSVGSTRRGST